MLLGNNNLFTALSEIGTFWFNGDKFRQYPSQLGHIRVSQCDIKKSVDFSRRDGPDTPELSE